MRLIVLVGELEAEVANGGFAQHLESKGEARAREALGCLESIGATRTARWLRSALRPGAARGTPRDARQAVQRQAGGPGFAGHGAHPGGCVRGRRAPCG
ncbi:MAG: DMP19 family protein [Acidobacteriota bacterium]